jgi:hypothetical protein
LGIKGKPVSKNELSRFVGAPKTVQRLTAISHSSTRPEKVEKA